MVLILLVVIATAVFSHFIGMGVDAWLFKNSTEYIITNKKEAMHFSMNAKKYSLILIINLLILGLLMFFYQKQNTNEVNLQDRTKKALELFILNNDYNCTEWININNYQYDKRLKAKKVPPFAIFKYDEVYEFPEFNFHIGTKWFVIGDYKKSQFYFEESRKKFEEKIINKNFFINFFIDNYDNERLRIMVENSFPDGMEKNIAKNREEFPNYKNLILTDIVEGYSYDPIILAAIDNTKRIITDKNFYLYRIYANKAMCFAKLHRIRQAKKWAKKSTTAYKEVILPNVNKSYPHNSIKNILNDL
jgi:tetratricopeptide (TPR) repeat protein